MLGRGMPHIGAMAGAFIIIVIYKRILTFVKNIYGLQQGFYFPLFVGHVTVDQDAVFWSAS